MPFLDLFSLPDPTDTPSPLVATLVQFQIPDTAQHEPEETLEDKVEAYVPSSASLTILRWSQEHAAAERRRECTKALIAELRTVLEEVRRVDSVATYPITSWPSRHLLTRTQTNQAPAPAQATAMDARVLQQTLDRVLATANGDAQAYDQISADTHPEVAACEKAIKDMLEHEQNQQMKEAELQRQREEAQARTEKLLAELRAAREKVRECVRVL